MATSRYLGLIEEATGASGAAASKIEEEMRWAVGGANPGTLDHLSWPEFSALAVEVAGAKGPA